MGLKQPLLLANCPLTEHHSVHTTAHADLSQLGAECCAERGAREELIKARKVGK